MVTRYGPRTSYQLKLNRCRRIGENCKINRRRNSRVSWTVVELRGHARPIGHLTRRASKYPSAWLTLAHWTSYIESWPIRVTKPLPSPLCHTPSRYQTGTYTRISQVWSFNISSAILRFAKRHDTQQINCIV